MRVDIYHASKYGNGEKVAGYLHGLLVARAQQADVHHVRDIRPKDAPPANLYIFCSPARVGKPIRSMRGFLKKVRLPEGARYAVIATYVRPGPNKNTGKMPTDQEVEKYRRTISSMDEIQTKGGSKVAELKVFVLQIKGPLEDGWQKKVENFAAQLG